MENEKINKCENSFNKIHNNNKIYLLIQCDKIIYECCLLEHNLNKFTKNHS